MTDKSFDAFALINAGGVAHWVGYDGNDWYLVCSGSLACTACLRWESDKPLCAGCVSETITEPIRAR